MKNEDFEGLEEKAIEILSDEAGETEKKLLGPEIKEIAQDEKFYSHIINYLTGIATDEDEAKRLWHNILRHKYLMSERLGRNAGISVAALDYFVNIDGRLGKVSFMDINKMKKISLDAKYDFLTRVFRKNVMEKKVQEIVSQAAEAGGVYSVIFFDVDNFKKYNDALGHLAGDAALYEVARSIRKNAENIFRFGGDEFVVVEIIGRDEADKLAESIAGDLENKKILIEKTGERLTLSFGVAAHPEDGYDFKSVLAAADGELYRKKKEKKNL